jgi:uncharacterized protein YjbI with pentapeptide repeats
MLRERKDRIEETHGEISLTFTRRTGHWYSKYRWTCVASCEYGMTIGPGRTVRGLRRNALRGGISQYDRWGLSGIGTDVDEITQSSNLRRAQLDGRDLHNGDFNGRDFSGASLRGVHFSGANLENANFRKADLTGAYLNKTNLKGADLTGANLKGAVFIYSDLTDAKIKGVTIESDFQTPLSKQFVPMEHYSGRARFYECILFNIDFSGMKLRDLDFVGSEFDGATLNGANVTGSKFHSANLEAAHTEGIIGLEYTKPDEDY